jgi:hypothetical protein
MSSPGRLKLLLVCVALTSLGACREESPSAPVFSPLDAGGDALTDSTGRGDVVADEPTPDAGGDRGVPDPETGSGDDTDAEDEGDAACTCDDGDPCNGVETCDPNSGECVAGEAVVCDDGDSCNGEESCEPESGECVAGEAVVCTDGDACNGVETCVPETGECADTEPVVCDDGDPCNGLETCDSDNGTCAPGRPVRCDDGNACNGVESCSRDTGLCQDGTPIQCSDGDLCNGRETCDRNTGDCLDGDPVLCTDGDPCNGVETCDPGSGRCLGDPVPSCPVAPSACDQNGGQDRPTEGRVVAAEAGGFRLIDQDTWAEKTALIDRLENHSSVTRVPLGTVLQDNLNRSGTRISVSGLGCFHDGFKWNSGDNEVDYWWPQGVTGSSDQNDTGWFAGRQTMLVSWYHKPEEDGNANFPKGVRISIVDHTNISAVRYRHALLAEPVDENGRVNLKPIAGRTSSVHAGGIVWVGDYLYIADTSSGMRVFDMTRILQVQTGQSNRLGYDANADEYHGYNYRYVIPQVGRYRLCESSCCARFSFISLDRTVNPARIVAGEYVSDASTGRLHAWQLDEETGRLWTTEGGIESSAAWFPGTKKIQGAAVLNGRVYLSSSNPRIGLRASAGSFHYAAGVGRNLSVRRYPLLPEDLYYRAQTDALWTCTEYPASWRGQTRYCFSFLTADVRNGCD